MNNINSWANDGQWNQGQGFGQTQQGGMMQCPNQGEEGEWQDMQQAPPPSGTGQPSGFYPGQVQGQFPFQGQGQVPYQTQNQFSGSGMQGFTGGQYRGHAGVQQGQGILSGQQTRLQGYQQISHQQIHLQQQQQQQQQQQMSYQQIQLRQQQQKQEMESRAREEQKQRDIEIQRRKMRDIDVSKPTSGSLEDLIAMPVSKKSYSPSVNRAKNQTNSPLQTRSAAVDVISTSDNLQSTQIRPQSGTDVIGNITTVSQPEVVSIDQLMESSLSNLGDPSPTTGRRSTFKPTHHSATSSSNRPPLTTNFSESSKARAWIADTSSLEGVFAQHSHQPQSADLLPEDGYGEFQSGPGEGASNFHSYGAQVKEQVVGQGTQFSGQGINAPGQGAGLPGQGAGLLGQKHLLREMPLGYAVRITMANQRPVPSTSISGLTKEGYISSDAMQSRSITSFSVSNKFPGRQPPTLGPLTSNFSCLDVSKFPEIYVEVYKRCAERGQDYLNTELLFPILLSSQLPKSVLKDLWTIANRTVPGKLSQTELFVLLGLVGLVQSGNPSPTVNDLKLSSHPPIPNLSAIKITQVTPEQQIQDKSSQNDEFGEFQQGQVMLDHPVTIPTSQLPPTKAPPIPDHPQAIGDIGVAFPVPDYKPPSDEKYSVFSDLSQLVAPTTTTTTTTTLTSEPRTGVTSSHALPSSYKSSSFNGDDNEFGSFLTGPPTSISSHSQFVAEQEGWATFPQLPPSVQPPTSASISAHNGGDVPSKDSNITAIVIATTTATTGLDNLSVDLNFTPKTKPKVSKKTLTALEILDEEMSNRITPAPVQSFEPPSLPVKSLVPQVVPLGSLDNFGKFEVYSGSVGDKDNGLESVSGSQTSFNKVAPNPCKVWKSCLDKCSEVLGSCSSVIANVEEKGILNEIAESEEGRNRLRSIIEVFRFSRRIYYAMKERRCDKECTDSIKSIKKEWKMLTETLPGNIMEKLYEETIPDTKEGDFLSDTISRCSLCLIGKEVCISPLFSLTGNSESYSLSLMFHEGQMYHPSCANFWTNVVQEKLPELNE